MDAISIGLALSLAGAQPPSPGLADEDEIIVTGERTRRTIHGAVEEPYPEVERVPTGSRIARKVRARPFRSIASDSGGMMAGAGATELNNYEMFGWRRIRSSMECVADHEQVQEHIVCGLIRVEEALADDKPEEAARLLAPLLRTVGQTRWERYYLGHFAYRTADALDDDAGRERALTQLLRSGRMNEADRLGAMRMLASLALRRGDDAEAVVRLENLIEVAPDDARSLANLAALHAQAGRHDQARLRFSEAVNIVQRSGQTPPPMWTEYLAEPH